MIEPTTFGIVADQSTSTGPDVLRYKGRWRYAKRTLDLALIAATLPLTLPLMAAVGIGVKVSSPGPVLFRQQRVGQHGEMITVLKFRTMYADSLERLHADDELYRQYVEHDFKLPVAIDPRIAPAGRFLRHTSLDELPQIFNVLGGSMSLVGPRPIVADELACYGPWAWGYLVAKPGITGRWQTAGRNHVRYPERAENDADYLTTWSLWSDVVILLKTVPTVLRRRGSQ